MFARSCLVLTRESGDLTTKPISLESERSPRTLHIGWGYENRRKQKECQRGGSGVEYISYGWVYGLSHSDRRKEGGTPNMDT